MAGERSGGGRPGIADVARRVGLSVSTVSRALNRSVLLRKETQERVLKAAEEIGYRKRTTRRHGGRAILTVALILPSTRRPSSQLFYDPSELVRGLVRGFGDTSVNVVVTMPDDSDQIIEQKKLGGVDGCVLAFSSPSRKLRARLDALGVPAVVLNRIGTTFNWVSGDNRGGMRELVGIVARKRGRIYRPCFIGYRAAAAVSAQRRKGFLEGVENLGIPKRRLGIIDVAELAELSPTLVTRLSSRGFDAVFCFNDFVALYFYQSALHAGLAVPDTFALTGFDNSPVLDLSVRRIDTMSLSVGMMAEEAGRWLVARAISRNYEPIRKLVPALYVPGDTVSPV